MCDLFEWDMQFDFEEEIVLLGFVGEIRLGVFLWLDV